MEVHGKTASWLLRVAISLFSDVIVVVSGCLHRAQVAGRTEGFRDVTIVLPKKDHFWLLQKCGQGGVFEKRTVLVCAVSVKAPALCKRKVKFTKYLCIFRESCTRVNGFSRSKGH